MCSCWPRHVCPVSTATAGVWVRSTLTGVLVRVSLFLSPQQSGFSSLTAVLREPWQPTLYPVTTFSAVLPGWLSFDDRTGAIGDDAVAAMLTVWLGSLHRRQLLFTALGTRAGPSDDPVTDATSASAVDADGQVLAQAPAEGEVAGGDAPAPDTAAEGSARAPGFPDAVAADGEGAVPPITVAAA
jgi:hypothetical protein